MDFLQITNWDSVLRLQREGGLPIGKPEGSGRWVGKRVNLQRWLDKTTNAGGNDEVEPVKNCKNLQDFTPQNAVDFSQVWNRWRTPRMEKFLEAYREQGLIAKACKAAGISRPTFYNWQKNYERFKTAIQEIDREVHGHGATEETAAA